VIEALRQRIIIALIKQEGIPLIKKSQALYWSPDDNRDLRAACTISKHYERTEDYWYAYHPDWDKFLKEARKGYYVLGCVDLNTAFVVPREWIQARLSDLYISTKGKNSYWHIVLARNGSEMILKTRFGTDQPVSQFAININ
jgi:hypothetical protein